MNSRDKKTTFVREIEFRMTSAKWESNMTDKILSSSGIRFKKVIRERYENVYFKVAAVFMIIALSAVVFSRIYTKNTVYSAYSSYLLPEDSQPSYYSFGY